MFPPLDCAYQPASPSNCRSTLSLSFLLLECRSQGEMRTSLDDLDQLEMLGKLALKPVARHEVMVEVHRGALPVSRGAEHDVQLRIIAGHRRRHEDGAVVADAEGASPLRETLPLGIVRPAKRQDRQKESALLALGVSVLALDFSHLGLDTILNKDAFRQVVLFDLTVRRWLHTVRGTMMVERTRHVIQAEIDQRNDLEKQQKLKKLEQRRLEREQRDAEHEMMRAHNEALRIVSQAARVAAFEAQQKSPEAQAERARRESLKQESSRRAEAIVTTILRAIESWGGAGAKCQRCYLISELDAQACGYCASIGPFKSVSFTQDYLGSAQARMRSSPKPDTSVAQVPSLSQEPGAAG